MPHIASEYAYFHSRQMYREWPTTFAKILKCCILTLNYPVKPPEGIYKCQWNDTATLFILCVKLLYIPG